ncbi:remodeling and spacing factor 1 [Caerostris darwini]|uniref:Remodeling and spacing factor 1 n=1 Tax=Caerostris darwini TaxID=1538125 RepID=A0AAV4RM43_9ARAC|nr:remodeling and spacing factor 1 [Caerostris darwini]
MMHPHCNRLNKKLTSSPPPVKPKLVTTFSMDVNEDVQIVSSISSPSPTKKKKGRLRQRGSASKPQVTPSPSPEPVKTPVKSSRQRMPRNSKKPAATSGKDNFTIPEGFLEILSNQSDTIKSEPQRKSRNQRSKISTPSAVSSESESAPIKRSRRIQEQHQKKMSELAVEMEKEQRLLEQLAKKSVKKTATPPKSVTKVPEPKINKAAKSKFQPPTPEETCMESKRTTRKMNSRSRNMTKMTLMYEDESKDSEFSTSRETEKSKKRRRGKVAKKGYKPWDLSSESSSSLEELTEEEEEEHEEEPLVFEVNEDEFACEEVDEDAEPIIVRRARTAKKAPEDVNTEENVVVDDKPCTKCGKYDKPEWILLCDKCDNGYHTTCLIPPLVLIPEGDWYCQPCEHKLLCEVLQKELHNLEVVLKQRQREELRKQRLAYVGISLDNVLKPEKKEKSDESSKEEEEEVESEHKRRRNKESSDEERHKKLYGKRSVRARRTVNYRFKEYDELIASALQEEIIEEKLSEDEKEFKEKEKDEDSDKSFTAKIPKRGRNRRRKASRLNDLDFSDEDEDSGEEYKGSSSESEQSAPPSGSDAESAASGEWRIVKNKGKSGRKARRKRGSSDEEWDENESDSYRPTTRRAAQKAISYREISSEDEEWNPKPKALPRKRKKEISSEDSEVSYKKKKKPKRKSRVRKWASSTSEESEVSMSFSGSSQGSEDEWKIKKSSEGHKIKLNINKKVLSSDENDDSGDSAPKKQPNKIVSEAESEEEEEGEDEEEEEEEDSSEEEEEDEEEEEESSEEEEEEEDTDKEVKTSKNLPPTKPKDIPSAKPKEASSPTEPKDISASKPKDISPSKVKDVPVLNVKNVPVSNVKNVPISNVKNVPVSNIKNVPISNVKNVPISNVKNVPISNVKNVPISNVKNVPISNLNNVPASNLKGIPATKLKDVPATKLKDVPATKIKDIPLSKLEEVPPLKLKELQPIKSEVKPVITEKEPVKSDVSNTAEVSNAVKNRLNPVIESVKEKLAVVTIKDKPPQRTVKKDVTKMVPCIIPYDKSPKSGHGTNPDEENDKELNKDKADYIPASVKQLPFNKKVATTSVSRSANPSVRPFSSTIIQPFSNIDDENDSDDEVPLERIPAVAPTPLPSKALSYVRESEYTPAKELSTFSYTTPEEKCFPPTYSALATFQDYSNRPSPLKPSLVETYSNKPRKKKQHFYGTPEPETVPRPVPSESYQGEIRFPPSPGGYTQRSSPHVQRDAGTPPRFHSQYSDSYAPPRSPEYYQNQQYYQGEERIPRPAYQPNYVPPEPVPPYVPNPYVATPVMQPNGGFMIDTLLRARNPENEEDELTGVTDIVSYITQE